jgi:hypothetical protein
MVITIPEDFPKMPIVVPTDYPQNGATGKGNLMPGAVVSKTAFKTVKAAFDYPPFKTMMLEVWKDQVITFQKSDYKGDKHSAKDFVSAVLEYPKVLFETDFMDVDTREHFKGVKILKLPFPKMVVVVGEETVEGEGLTFFYSFVVCQAGDFVRMVVPLIDNKTAQAYIMDVPLLYVETPTGEPNLGMALSPEQRSWVTQNQLNILSEYVGYVIYMMTMNPTAVQASISIPTKEEIEKNKKRIGKNKKPLIEFKLITIDGKKPDPIKAPPAGTHASPKQHWRRGHWRNYASGKSVFIDPMLVGDEKNGKIIKDYAVGLYDDAKNKRVPQGFQ